MTFKHENRVITLCSSWKFKNQVDYIEQLETRNGNLVFSFPVDASSMDPDLPETKRIWSALTKAHDEKIRKSDEVVVVNPGYYLGNSVMHEIYTAIYYNRRIVFTHPFLHRTLKDLQSDTSPEGQLEYHRIMKAQVKVLHSYALASQKCTDGYRSDFGNHFYSSYDKTYIPYHYRMSRHGIISGEGFQLPRENDPVEPV